MKKTDKQEMKANPEFGKTIHIRRQAFGYTQRDLARLVGVQPSHIAYLENGRRLPSLGLLVRLAKELKVRPSKLALQAFPILAKLGMK
jgi:transcriptional regulator with XRE-family HTH domain